MAKPHIDDAIRAVNANLLAADLATLAIGVLRRILEDASAPRRIKLQAAIAVLDRAGHAPQHAEPAGKARVEAELRGKSMAELQAILADTEARLAELEAEDDPPVH
jgi:hypothetical protein